MPPVVPPRVDRLVTATRTAAPPGAAARWPVARSASQVRGLLDVLARVADGLVNEDVGAELRLSVNTVKTRLRVVFADLGARDRAHAVALGFRLGLLDGPAHRADCAAYRPRVCDCGTADDLD